MKKRLNSQAFTLVETIIAISVTAIFFTLVSSIIISVNRTYQEMTKINEMNNEVAMAYQVFSLNINAINKTGKGVVFISSHELESDFLPFIKITHEASGTIKVAYQKESSNLIAFEYKNLKDIVISHKGNDLLEIKIINNKNHERRMIFNIIGGIN